MVCSCAVTRSALGVVLEDAGMLYICLIFYNFMNFDGFGGLPFLSVSEKVSESIHRYYCYIKKDTLAYLVGEDDDSL